MWYREQEGTKHSLYTADMYYSRENWEGGEDRVPKGHPKMKGRRRKGITYSLQERFTKIVYQDIDKYNEKLKEVKIGKIGIVEK